jgi:hypothetical protein
MLRKTPVALLGPALPCVSVCKVCSRDRGSDIRPSGVVPRVLRAEVVRLDPIPKRGSDVQSVVYVASRVTRAAAFVLYSDASVSDPTGPPRERTTEYRVPLYTASLP